MDKSSRNVEVDDENMNHAVTAATTTTSLQPTTTVRRHSSVVVNVAGVTTEGSLSEGGISRKHTVRTKTSTVIATAAMPAAGESKQQQQQQEISSKATAHSTAITDPTPALK